MREFPIKVISLWNELGKRNVKSAINRSGDPLWRGRLGARSVVISYSKLELESAQRQSAEYDSQGQALSVAKRVAPG